MNIYFHELRTYRKNTIIWIVALCAVTAFFFSMYPAFSTSANVIVDMLKQFPQAVKDALGFPIDMLGSVLGFYSFLIMCITICGAVQGMYLGISVLAKETTGKTADFLLTKPVTRTKVMTSKILAVFTCITVTSAAYLVAATVTVIAVSTQDFNYVPFLLMTLSVYLIQIIFLALGLLAAVVIPKIKSVLPVSLSAVFSFFIIGTIGGALNQEKLFYLSPFKYFDTLYIIENSSYKMSYLAVGAMFVAAAVILTYVIYSKRDIHAV